MLDEDKNQFTIESLRENCEKYYSKATVESMVSLNNVIGHDLYHFIDNKLYIYDGGIGDDITVGGMKAVKLFELADGSRVFEIELERFSEIDFSVIEPDTVYFTMVNENGRYVFDNMYCVDH